MAKKKKSHKTKYSRPLCKICKIVDGDVSAEVIATDFENISLKVKSLQQ